MGMAQSTIAATGALQVDAFITYISHAHVPKTRCMLRSIVAARTCAPSPTLPRLCTFCWNLPLLALAMRLLVVCKRTQEDQGW